MPQWKIPKHVFLGIFKENFLTFHLESKLCFKRYSHLKIKKEETERIKYSMLEQKKKKKVFLTHFHKNQTNKKTPNQHKTKNKPLKR